MQLSRMDDIAGCRLIFRNISELDEFRIIFHAARFKHVRKNTPDKYNYIIRPKKTGYRGIHDVYEYDVNSQAGKDLTGLYVEIQYRTLVQHAWATAVEIIGYITESQPKFQKGDNRYEKAMALASEILSRAFENSTGPFPELTNSEIVRQFNLLDNELSLLQTLRGLNAADEAVSNKKNVILILSISGETEIKAYRDAPEALSALFELEKTHEGRDIVLVRANTSSDVRLAFKNYFSDARDFIDFIEKGRVKLSDKP